MLSDRSSKGAGGKRAVNRGRGSHSGEDHAEHEDGGSLNCILNSENCRVCFERMLIVASRSWDKCVHLNSRVNGHL